MSKDNSTAYISTGNTTFNVFPTAKQIAFGKSVQPATGTRTQGIVLQKSVATTSCSKPSLIVPTYFCSAYMELRHAFAPAASNFFTPAGMTVNLSLTASWTSAFASSLAPGTPVTNPSKFEKSVWHYQIQTIYWLESTMLSRPINDLLLLSFAYL